MASEILGQIIVDLDTLVDTSQAMGLQGDWEAYNQALLSCPPNKHCTALARKLQISFDLVIFTTRGPKDYQATLDWLALQGIIPEGLLHRPEFNTQPELELFQELLSHAYDSQLIPELVCAITSKAKTAEFWRGQGIQALEATPIVRLS